MTKGKYISIDALKQVAEQIEKERDHFVSSQKVFWYEAGIEHARKEVREIINKRGLGLGYEDVVDTLLYKLSEGDKEKKI